MVSDTMRGETLFVQSHMPADVKMIAGMSSGMSILCYSTVFKVCIPPACPHMLTCFVRICAESCIPAAAPSWPTLQLMSAEVTDSWLEHLWLQFVDLRMYLNAIMPRWRKSTLSQISVHPLPMQHGAHLSDSLVMDVDTQSLFVLDNLEVNPLMAVDIMRIWLLQELTVMAEYWIQLIVQIPAVHYHKIQVKWMNLFYLFIEKRFHSTCCSVKNTIYSISYKCMLLYLNQS